MSEYRLQALTLKDPDGSRARKLARQLIRTEDLSVYQAIEEPVLLFGADILAALVDGGIRIHPLRDGERYIQASSALRQLGIDFDEQPVPPPAGAFIRAERCVYLQSYSAMTIVHELGHAADMVLGGFEYWSSTSRTFARVHARARAFITPYATRQDEAFAETTRALHGKAGDPASVWPPATYDIAMERNPATTELVLKAFTTLAKRGRRLQRPKEIARCA